MNQVVDEMIESVNLMLFFQLKGCPSSEVNQVVDEMIESVNLMSFFQLKGCPSVK